ncbi:MAG: ABC transporter ATP-binding protein [Planctomycetes bacterium]|nr:ABC transporter ATP-binding protein [Planctomycetota bacterium]
MKHDTLLSLSALERKYDGEAPAKTLYYLFTGHHLRLAAAVLAYMAKTSPVWAMPLFTAYVIDLVAVRDPSRLGQLGYFAVAMALLTIQNIPTHTMYIRWLSTVTRTVETQLRSALTRQLQHLSISYYSRQSAGRLQNKVLRDVEVVENLARMSIEWGVGTICSVVIAVGTTALRAPAFLLIFLFVVPPAALITRRLHREIGKRNHEFRMRLEEMGGRMLEMTHLIPVARAHALESVEIENTERSLACVREAGLKLDVANAVFGASGWVLVNIFNVSILILTAWAYVTKRMSVSLGDIVLLTGYFRSLTNSLLGVIGMIPQFTRGFESIRSIGEVLQCPDLEVNEGRDRLEEVRGEFSFEEVRYRYEGAEEEAVKGVSLKIGSGTSIALVGPSGSGKSTMLNLLIGFVRPTSGRILLDGRSMEELDLRSYRRFLAVVPQEAILFHGTVRDNIVFGLAGIDDERIWSAVRDANAVDFIEKLPKGLDTLIGERGACLSGGQKQRLAIARALIRNPRVLIMDEPTSALDVESEAQVQEALERLMKGRTTFVAAHRLSTIRKADRIVVMENGKITESGGHDDLIQQGGSYARLYARQS